MECSDKDWGLVVIYLVSIVGGATANVTIGSMIASRLNSLWLWQGPITAVFLLAGGISGVVVGDFCKSHIRHEHDGNGTKF